MDRDKMLEYAYDLRSDLKYAFEQGEGQTPNHKDVAVMDWLIEQAKKVEALENELTGYKLSNQSFSNALDKEIKENERLRKFMETPRIEPDKNWRL